MAASAPVGVATAAARIVFAVPNPAAGNAIKFTEHGEVVVRVRPDSLTAREAVLHFLVSDTGIGIPSDKRAAIFAPFVQGDGSMSRQYGGTGLGLAIASQLVEMMGGRIWVESEVGRGSTFHFTVRLGLADGTRNRHDVPQGLDRVRVLLVDDNATSRQILLEMVGGWGMTAMGVGDGPSALAALGLAHQRDEPFSLALVDAHMPDPDGAAIVRAIQANPDFAATRLILLTAAGVPLDRGRELNGVLLLSKPIARSQLLEAIQALHSGQAVDDGGRRPAIERTRRDLRVLVAEDNAVNRKVTTGLLRKRGHQVIAVEDGRRALAALDQDRFDVILMDVQMPGLNGLDATAAIRAREHEGSLPRIAIVALTAHAMTGDRERCLAAGMDGYVSKPVEAEELFEAIERFGNEASAERGPHVSPDDGTAVLDRDAVVRRLGGDAELRLEAVKTFNDESAELLDAIRHSVAGGDAARLATAAHSLKGARGTLAASAAAEAARQLEQMGRRGDLAHAEEGRRKLEREMVALRRALASLVA